MTLTLPASSRPSSEPNFPADAAVRRVHREGVLLLGGGRALLMQIAHPDVARGVAEHSSYQHRRVDRLLRTLRSTLALVYGTEEQAVQAAAGVTRMHQHVQGAGYSAMDADLQAWVLATLIDTSVEMHERFLGPIAADEPARYYEEMCRVGKMLGTPRSAMPADLAGLREYVESMSRSLIVSDTARAIAGDLFAPLPRTGPAMALMRHLTAGLLHPQLREGFGLGWGGLRERQLRGLQQVSRLILPRTPLRLRRTPGFLLPEGARL